VVESDSADFQIVKTIKVKILYTYLPASAVRKERKLLLSEHKRGQNWKHGTPQRVTDMELEWEQTTCSVNTLAFSGLLRLNIKLFSFSVIIQYVIFQVLTVVTLRSTISCLVTPCSLGQKFIDVSEELIDSIFIVEE
jgi:hypothetical protein